MLDDSVLSGGSRESGVGSVEVELHQGDCLSWLGKAPSDAVDLVVTSPPYDDLRTYTDDFQGFGPEVWRPCLAELLRVLKPGGVCVWIVGDGTTPDGSESLSSFRQACHWRDMGGVVHDTMVWDKGGFSSVGDLRVRYAPVFEFMFILSKGRPSTFNPLKDRPNRHASGVNTGTIRQRDGSMRRMSSQGSKQRAFGQRFNVWRQPPCRDRKVPHPARFPVALARDHVVSWSNPGDVVLDPFMGSGTTGVACAKEGRSFVGVELSEEYFKVARNRIEEAGAQSLLPLSTAGSAKS